MSVNVVILSFLPPALLLSHLLQSQHLHISPFMRLANVDDTTEVICLSQSLYELIEDLVRMVVLPVHGVVGGAPLHLPGRVRSGLLYQPGGLKSVKPSLT